MKFLVLFEGRHLTRRVEGVNAGLGFYANRVVDAPSVSEIPVQIEAEKLLGELASNGVQSTVRTIVRLSRVSLLEETEEQQFSGFSFFPESSGALGWLKKLFRLH